MTCSRRRCLLLAPQQMPLTREFLNFVLALILLSSTYDSAVADEVKVGTGIDCSVGKYGQTTPVQICLYPNSIHAFLGTYELKLSLPYVEVRDGSGIKGYGDSSFYAGKTVAENFYGIDAVDLGVKVKARNGSVDLGLGTGRTAYSGGVALTWLPAPRQLYVLYLGFTSMSRNGSEIGSYATVWYKYLATDNMRLGLIYENNEIGYSKRIETFTLMPELVVSGNITFKPFVYIGLNSFAPSKGAGLVASYSFQ